jgi:AraC family L-rhamnose operon transcriptional activator RhaR
MVLYLGGQGIQKFANSSTPVEVGTAVFLPAGALHGFQHTSERAPLSLVIDFQLVGDQLQQETVRSINGSELANIRRELARLLKRRTTASGELPLERATVALQILIGLLRTAGWLQQLNAVSADERNPAIQQLLSKMDPTVPLINVVHRSGYNRDYLNRLVKKETGLTLGQLRNQQRLAKAKQLLTDGFQVGSAAAIVGLPDQSYFARWFRLQTGKPPSHWIRQLART